MKIIISHPTSNQFNRSALTGLLEKGMLGEYHTTVASFPGSLLNRMSRISALSDIKRRNFEQELSPYTYSSPYYEIGRIMSAKFGFSQLTRHEKGVFCLDSVYRLLDKKVSKRLERSFSNGVTSVYAYEDGALYSFRKAQHLGMNCFYDLPIGYWRTMRKLLQREAELWPEWSSTLTGLKDSEEKLARKDEELSLADRIFVASSFTANSLKDYQGNLAPVDIVPYGFPPAIEKRIYEKKISRPLKLLFVGGLSQRKGIANLFAAVKPLKDHVSLTIVGRKTTGSCPALDVELKRHKWIESLPHDKILALMRIHDVLVFPSLFEGFGMVITEAMSQGTPVITTDRTAGPDIISNEENGWIVEAGNTEALTAAIAHLIQRPNRIMEAGESALESAKQRPWEVYGIELAEAIATAQKLKVAKSI